MRYKARAVFNPSGVLGFAIESASNVWMYYTVPRLDITELHRPPDDQPATTSLEALSAEDFPRYVHQQFGKLRVGEVFTTDDLPAEFRDKADRVRFADWFQAKAKDMQP